MCQHVNTRYKTEISKNKCAKYDVIVTNAKQPKAKYVICLKCVTPNVTSTNNKYVQIVFNKNNLNYKKKKESWGGESQSLHCTFCCIISVCT